MKRKTVGLVGMAIIMALFVSLSSCADGDSLSSMQSVSAAGLSPDTCSAWIQAQHSLDYDDHGCEEYADVLAYAESIGGGVIPVGEDRFFII